MSGFRLSKSRQNVDSRLTALALVAAMLATAVGVAAAATLSVLLTVWGG